MLTLGIGLTASAPAMAGTTAGTGNGPPAVTLTEERSPRNGSSATDSARIVLPGAGGLGQPGGAAEAPAVGLGRIDPATRPTGGSAATGQLGVDVGGAALLGGLVALGVVAFADRRRVLATRLLARRRLPWWRGRRDELGQGRDDGRGGGEAQPRPLVSTMGVETRPTRSISTSTQSPGTR
ncbi:hypothetical protein [Frankia nepalensis]|uniref:hypothetical protein n=1 Tax=Frankia nepalensis TaxID=1836974 RepID=UPI0019319272|nr:hypothetical protein [Frankia nepalensis]MBL7514365.1 hypothetical protein [Frankia nepalensis]